MMTENTQNETNFIGKAAEIASDYSSGRGKHAKEENMYESNDMYMKALNTFVPRTEGQVTPNEIQFLEYCINGSIINGEDPSHFVVVIAEKLNDIQKRIVLKYLQNATDVARDVASGLTPDTN